MWCCVWWIRFSGCRDFNTDNLNIISARLRLLCWCQNVYFNLPVLSSSIQIENSSVKRCLSILVRQLSCLIWWHLLRVLFEYFVIRLEDTGAYSSKSSSHCRILGAIVFEWIWLVRFCRNPVLNVYSSVSRLSQLGRGRHLAYSLFPSLIHLEAKATLALSCRTCVYFWCVRWISLYLIRLADLGWRCYDCLDFELTM